MPRRVLLLAAVLALASAPPTAPFDGDPATTERVSAGTPVAAAVGASRIRFDDDAARHVVLAREDAYADALAGAPLSRPGPLLFTSRDALPAATRAELNRVLPRGAVVYLLGGRAAIGEQVETELVADGYEARRLAGASRVETAVAIADELRRGGLATGGQVALARASGPPEDPTAGWADAIAGGAWATSAHAVVLVTPRERLHPAVAAALDRYDPERVVLLGGEAALSQEVERAVPNPQRVAGDNRAETAVLVALRLFDEADARRFVIVPGYRPDGWAFALAAAAFTAEHAAPALLTATDDVPIETLQPVSSPCGGAAQVDLVLVGDASVISERAQGQLDNVDGGPCPPEETSEARPAVG
jgi:putative cell wall-binding protein